MINIVINVSGGCPVANACTTLAEGDCPIEAGEKIVYDMELFIDPTFPSVSTVNTFQCDHFGTGKSKNNR